MVQVLLYITHVSYNYMQAYVHVSVILFNNTHDKITHRKIGNLQVTRSCSFSYICSLFVQNTSKMEN